MSNDQLKLQIYGERCSGTNFLEQLLLTNLHSIQITWDYGWKHFFHDKGVEQSSDYLFVIIYRNPFNWIKSFHKHPWHTALDLRDISLSEFIRKEWKCIWDEDAEKTPENPIYGTEMLFERCPVTQKRFSNILKMRTAKIRNWESLREKVEKTIYVQYETLVSAPEAFIQKISDCFYIKRASSFQGIQSYKGLGQEYSPTVYNTLSEKDIHFIIEELEVNLEKSIGYDLYKLAKQQLL